MERRSWGQPWPSYQEWNYVGSELQSVALRKSWPGGASTQDRVELTYASPRRQLKNFLQHHEWRDGGSLKTSTLMTDLKFDARGLLTCAGTGGSDVCELAANGPHITRYSYDDQTRLTSVQIDSDITNYNYHSDGRPSLTTLGNGTSVEYQYHDLHSGDESARLKGIVHKRDTLTVASFLYDYYRGGMIRQERRQEEGDERVWLMDYDALDQLVQVQAVDAADNPGAVLGIYDYDAFGQRIREWHAQLDASGAPLAGPMVGLERFYFQGRVQEERHLDALPGALPNRYHWVGGELLAANIEGERGYAHSDVRGSTSAVSNASGEIVGNWRVDPWGRVNASESNDDGLGAQRQVFGGHVSDAATGLMYMRARYYDPEAGLFLTEDPASGSEYDPRSQHRYLYAHSNPINATDPTGRSTVFIGQHGTGVFEGAVGNPTGYNPVPAFWTEELHQFSEQLREDSSRYWEAKTVQAVEDTEHDPALIIVGRLTDVAANNAEVLPMPALFRYIMTGEGDPRVVQAEILLALAGGIARAYRPKTSSTVRSYYASTGKGRSLGRQQATKFSGAGIRPARLFSSRSGGTLRSTRSIRQPRGIARRTAMGRSNKARAPRATKRSQRKGQERRQAASDGEDGDSAGSSPGNPCALTRGCFAAGTLVTTATGLIPIETVDLGQRVVTDDIQLLEWDGEDESGKAACPTQVGEDWSRLTLVVDGSADGKDFIAEVLRSPEWMRSHHAAVGGTVWLDIDELGVSDDARVLAIEDAPFIEDGPGCVVLSRYTRANSNLIELSLGNGERLELTDTHRVYSATRDAWVRAGRLWEGEYLRGAFSTVPVDELRVLQGTRQVFNLEVEGRHRYLVGEARVLAHNTGCDEGAGGEGGNARGRLRSVGPNTWESSGGLGIVLIPISG